ncbi:MAG: putative hydroxymethylpyrimidine transporter CytX [Chloroflexota bacterium]
MAIEGKGVIARVMPRIKAPPEWGIEPVPREHRLLGFLDYFVLWADLGVGLLVLLAGTLLVPGLGLGQALVAIVIGTLIGNLLLALAGVVGSDNAIPTMVMLRPALGIRGSYLPTALNVLQLLGWTIFEIIIMGYGANEISKRVLGLDSYIFWAAVFALVVILMGIGGPVAVVRQWLEKFAVWMVLITTLWLTFHILTTYDVAALLRQPGKGGLPFWVAVDIVIAMPVSWLPLVADYNRFARHTGRGFWGTYLGYLVTNIWFYGLGALVLLAAAVTQEPKGFVAAIALTAGLPALLIFLVDETDNAWADLYSAAVSVQNVFPRVRQRWLIIGLGVFSFLVAAVLDITQYETFLLLIGSVFVPIFGVLAADYFVLRQRRYQVDELYRPNGAYWYRTGMNIPGVLAWLLGVLAYQVANPGFLSTYLPTWGQWIPSQLTQWGGSLPAFVVAFGTCWVLGQIIAREPHPVSEAK